MREAGEPTPGKKPWRNLEKPAAIRSPRNDRQPASDLGNPPSIRCIHRVIMQEHLNFYNFQNES